MDKLWYLDDRAKKANIITATLTNGTVFTIKDRWSTPERDSAWLDKNQDAELRFYSDRLRTKEL